MSTPKTIILKSRGNDLIKEALAGGVIKPGHMIKRSSATQVVVHATAAGNAEKLFAVEQVLIDSLSAADIDTACASGDQIPFVVALRGDEIYALVAANATAITMGAMLESAGDGTVRIASTDAATDDTQRDSVVGYALEALDNSANGSVVRIKIEVA